MDGLEAEPGRLVCEGRAANWLLRSGVRLHKGTSCSFQVSRLYWPQDKWRHKTTVASVAGNDPFSRNLGNDIPWPFVAVKITVAGRELGVCPPATCARAAWSGSRRRSELERRTSISCWFDLRPWTRGVRASADVDVFLICFLFSNHSKQVQTLKQLILLLSLY